MIRLGYLVDWTDWYPDEDSLKKLTHVHYAFARVGNEYGIVVENFERAHQIRTLKQRAPHLKVSLSIGGWGAGFFSEAASTEENRKRFSQSSIEIMQRYGFDGIDIDWEYPGVATAGISSSPDDKQNFTLMLKQCREDLDALEAKTGERYLLSIAASGSMASGFNCELTEIIKYLDFINVMTYDMEKWGYSSYHTNLFTSSRIQGQYGGAHYIEEYIKNGVPAEKLALGIAFYGRGGHGVKGDEDGLNGVIEKDKHVSYSWTKIHEEILKDRSYTEYWDEEAQAPYVYNGDIFLSYDNPRSVTAKVDYAKKMNLAGVFFWQFMGDFNGELIDVIYRHGKDEE